MTQPSYVPQPGTIPFRAIEHLKTLPASAEISTAVLCEAIDQTAGGFTTCMRRAVDAGAVRSRTRLEHVGRQLWWSLGDGKPPPLIDEPDADDDQALDAAARRPRAKPPLIPLLAAPRSTETCPHGRFLDAECVFCRPPEIPLAEPEQLSIKPRTCSHGVAMTIDCDDCTRSIALELRRADALTPIVAPAPLPRVRAGTAPARWGIFSDGDFHIQKAGTEIVLDRAELEQLVAFLERLAASA